jgi:hypothetical protein
MLVSRAGVSSGRSQDVVLQDAIVLGGGVSPPVGGREPLSGGVASFGV